MATEAKKGVVESLADRVEDLTGKVTILSMENEKMRKMMMENEKLYSCLEETVTVIRATDPMEIQQQQQKDKAMLEEKYEMVAAVLASMEKEAVMAESLLEESRQYETKQAQPSPRCVELKEEASRQMAKLKMFLSSIPEPSLPQVETHQQQQPEYVMTFEERFEEMERMVLSCMLEIMKTGTVKELETLKGIGHERAKKIYTACHAGSRVESFEDLVNKVGDKDLTQDRLRYAIKLTLIDRLDKRADLRF